MLHVGYEIWGLALIGLLLGGWTLKRIKQLKNSAPAIDLKGAASHCSCRGHDIDHRVLMFLMDQKTDSMLATLARTIENERKKLGVGVRNPSMATAIDAIEAKAIPATNDHPSCYEQIMPMATSGLGISKIARQLQLPEAEVSMVLRLNAA